MVITSPEWTLANGSYELTASSQEHDVWLCLKDLATGFAFADSPYVYRATRACDEGLIRAEWLLNPTVDIAGDELKIVGRLAGLELEHVLRLPADQAFMEERITLRNGSVQAISLRDFACGFQRLVTDARGRMLPELSGDRFVAIPLRHRATDAADWDNDFGVAHFLTHLVREPRATHSGGVNVSGFLPSQKRSSEGWAWTHGEHTLAVFKFNQEAMEFSLLVPEVRSDGLALRFGGAGMIGDEPSALGRIAPGQTVSLGVTRYQTIPGGFTQACYVWRGFLDERGCRFPRGYNPPVHWNELYDNKEWHLALAVPPEKRRRRTRQITYTKALILEEAAKAKEYGCEALYLDPGWDVDLGSFLWGEEWLGDRRQFAQELRDRYGLGLSLHTPLASWLSYEGQGVTGFPRESFRTDSAGRLYESFRVEGPCLEGSVCLGSKQYLDEAERRLLANCADGAVFLMFDGNWWNGTCWNPDHGHPVPYTMEDHCRANLDLAQRVHARYPDVLVEMHDMVMGGADVRYTPLYYKYGLPGSFDENWGFELMWNCMHDMRSGRARSLYYYNLGCNIPTYTHIDLRDDNEHCLVLWWFASTCRHLGIGGTHDDPMIAQSHRLAMRRYRQLDRFYKRGEFYGLGEEIHVHALPEENAFVMNLFNLSDAPRTVKGSMLLDEMGLVRDRWYATPKGGRFDPVAGTFAVRRHLPAWGAQVVEVTALAVE